MNAQPELFVEGFHGPGGMAEGRRLLGMTTPAVGMELDALACATAVAAGHRIIRCDVTQYPTRPFLGRRIHKHDSPVCTPWSRAGKRLGLVDQPLVHQAVHDLAYGRDTRVELKAACLDPMSMLAAEPMRWHHDLRPETITMEQVEDVLPLWRHYAEILTGWGYSVWTGVLNAADYGVPQTRRRAILIASQVRDVAAPEATHSEHDHGMDLFGNSRQPWIAMADALDLPDDTEVITRGDRKTPGGNVFPASRPSWGLTGRARSWMLHTNRDQRPDGSRQTIDPYTRPAPSLTTKAGGQWKLRHDSGYERLLEIHEAAVLQSFPADYPWQGTKTAAFTQCGNAVPPLLARAVLAAATGAAAAVLPAA